MSGDASVGAGPREVWLFTSEVEGMRAGSFRQERWCRVFLEHGAHVTVFNLRGAVGRTEIRFADLESFDAWRAAQRGAAPAVAGVRHGPAARVLRALKHATMVDLYLPNVLGLVRSAVRRLRAARPGPVLLMASSPPFSLAVAAAAVRALAPDRVVFAVDMRDAWALHDALGGFAPLRRAIERRVLRAAHDVTTVSHGLRREFQAEYGIEAGTLYNVATHYFVVPPSEPVDWSAVHPALRSDRRTLLYTGSTPDGFYDVETFVGGVRTLRERDPALADRVQCVFVGACEPIAAEARRQGVTEPALVFVDHLPQPRVQALQQAADALLFLAFRGIGNRGVVSTKLFEYFALGRPVVAVSVDPGSDVDHLLRRYAGHAEYLRSPEDVAAALAGLAADGGVSLPRVRNPDTLRSLLDGYRDRAAALLAS